MTSELGKYDTECQSEARGKIDWEIIRWERCWCIINTTI